MKTLNVFTIKELPEEQQQEAINGNREINLSDDWYLFTLYNFVKEVKVQIGIDLKPDDVKFDLFGRGNYIYIDSGVLVDALQQKYPQLDNFGLPVKFGLFSNYMGGGLNSALCESEYSADGIELQDNYEAGDLEGDLEKVQQQGIIRGVLADCGLLHDLLRNCFRDLVAEYEYMLSDEAVKETLLINEVLFLSDGTNANGGRKW